jgi:hypothetical protein
MESPAGEILGFSDYDLINKTASSPDEGDTTIWGTLDYCCGSAWYSDNRDCASYYSNHPCCY